MGIIIEAISCIIRFSQSLLFDLKKDVKKRRYNILITFVIYDICVKNVYKSGRLGISL